MRVTEADLVNEEGRIHLYSRKLRIRSGDGVLFLNMWNVTKRERYLVAEEKWNRDWSGVQAHIMRAAKVPTDSKEQLTWRPPILYAFRSYLSYFGRSYISYSETIEGDRFDEDFTGGYAYDSRYLDRGKVLWMKE